MRTHFSLTRRDTNPMATFVTWKGIWENINAKRFRLAGQPAATVEGDLKCISSIHLEKCCLVFLRVISMQNAHQLTHKTKADAIPISFRIAQFFQRPLRSPLKVPFEVTFCTKALLVIWRRHDFMSEWECTSSPLAGPSSLQVMIVLFCFFSPEQ